jgi:tripartite-type tricarboxylate transporter receptor subunit TctC
MYHSFLKMLCATFSAWAMFAAAQNFPSRPVTIVVPFAAGGPSDSIARIINSELSARWGQQVVIDNKPGGGTVIGTTVVANSTPDGHTLLSGSFANVTNEFLISKLPYSSSALTPVAFLGHYPLILFVGAGNPAHNVPDLIERVNRSGRRLLVGNAGNGSSAHLAAVDFGQASGLDIISVPYKGSQPSMIDLMGGQIDAMFEGATYKGLADSGKVKALFVGQSARMPQWPSLQTAAEAGLPGYISAAWYGIFAPAKTPSEVQRRIAADFAAVLALPRIQGRLLELGLAPEPLSQAQFAAHLEAERRRLGALIQTHNIRLE